MSSKETTYVLGKECNSEDEHHRAVEGVMYITFRSGFRPTSKGFTSDTGFGCLYFI